MSSCLGRCSSRMARCRTASAVSLALTPGGRSRRCNCPFDAVAWNIEVGYRPHGGGSEHAEANPVSAGRAFVELVAAETSLAHVEDDDIGFHRARIQLNAGDGRQLASQASGPLMVLSQALHVVLQGVDPSRGDNPGLAHSPAKSLLEAPGLLNEPAGAGQHRANWRAQPLAQVDPE